MDFDDIDPVAAGLDPASLERISEHLRSRYLEPGKIAGCQVAIWRDGRLGHLENFGLADRERDRPVANDTIWRLYSMTKPITGVALMQLYERGHFQLDDGVDRWLPEWRDLKVAMPDGSFVPAEQVPTVRQVLTHTSGIGYGEGGTDLDLENKRYLKGLTLETLMPVIAGWPLGFQPGTHWRYSHGMDVAARLVEIMSGQRFDDYLDEHVFGPLGMSDTAFFVSDDRVDRFAANYARNARKELVLYDDPEASRYRREPRYLNGGGGLVGTMGDYLRFVAMLAGGGTHDGARILGRKTVELMTSNHLPGDAELADLARPGGYGEVGFDGNGFGLTMSVSKSPAATGVAGSPGEFGWGGAASTTFWVDPVEDLAVVFMTQLMPSGTFNFGGQLRSIVHGALR